MALTATKEFNIDYPYADLNSIDSQNNSSRPFVPCQKKRTRNPPLKDTDCENGRLIIDPTTNCVVGFIASRGNCDCAQCQFGR